MMKRFGKFGTSVIFEQRLDRIYKIKKMEPMAAFAVILFIV